MTSFFSSLQTERTARKTYLNQGGYQRRRVYKSPMDFERGGLPSLSSGSSARWRRGSPPPGALFMSFLFHKWKINGR